MPKNKNKPSERVLTKAVIYARYSSSGQREESIEGQLRDCRSYAMKNSMAVVGEYIDRAMTGTSDKRPDFQRMIRDSAKGLFAVVLVWKIDRFARSRYDSAIYKNKLKANGVRVVSANETIPDTPEGIVLESVMEGFAEYYSANLSQNVRRGNYDSALKRQSLGHHILGYRTGADKRFELDPQTAPVVLKIFQDFLAGKKLRDIADELNANGHRTVLGKPFTANALRYILKNERYTGLYVYEDIRDEHGIPEIIDRETFARAQVLIEEHRRTPAAKKSQEVFMLTGKLFCGDCGEPMSGAAGTSHTGKVYTYYMCLGKEHGTCTHPRVRKSELENAVLGELMRAVHSNDVIQAFADRFMIWQSEQSSTEELDGLRAKLRETETAIKNVMRFVDTGIVSDSLRTHLMELEAERVDLVRGIAKLELENPKLKREDVVWFLEQFREGNVTDEKWKLQLTETFLRAAYLYTDGRLLLQLNFCGAQSKTSTKLAEAAVEAGEEERFNLARSGAPDEGKGEPLSLYFYAGIFVILSRFKQI